MRPLEIGKFQFRMTCLTVGGLTCHHAPAIAWRMRQMLHAPHSAATHLERCGAARLTRAQSRLTFGEFSDGRRFPYPKISNPHGVFSL